MIRQAHTYLAGAVSGTALIAAAVVAFVLLVSLQALRDWPLAGIGGGGRQRGGLGRAAGDRRGSSSRRLGAAGPAPANGNGRRQGGAGSLGAVAAAAQPASAPRRRLRHARPPANRGLRTRAAAAAGSAPSASIRFRWQAGGGSGPGAGAGSGQSTSGAVTGTVNDTVSGVDQATGGALGDTGVTKVTEEIVNGVAGPESTVGKTVDKVVETVGGLLGGGK